MSWSEGFLAACSGGRDAGLRFRARLVAPDGKLRMTLERLESVSLTAPRVAVQTWGCSAGAATLQALDVDAEEAAEVLYRRICIEIIVVPNGWAEVDGEVIFRGVVQRARVVAYDAASGRCRLALEAWDLVAGLATRLTTVAGQAGLAYDLQSTTVAGGGYTPGDASLQVASTTNFGRRSGGSGLLLCTPASGDSFFVTYSGTGTGPIRFTGLSTTDKFGTTQAALSSGDSVQEVAYWYGHPLDVVRHLLHSTGGTTSSIYDLMPAKEGYGLRHDWADHDEIDRWKYVVAVASGSYQWDLMLVEEERAPGAWLGDLLARAGIWLVMRHGLVAVRAAFDPADTRKYISTFEITESDIADAKVDLFNPTRPAVFATQTVATGNGSSRSDTGTGLGSGPVDLHDRRDLSGVVWSNNNAVEDEVAERLEGWSRRLDEVITVTCAGLRCAGLVPGDVVSITTSRIWTRAGRGKGSIAVDQQRAMVITAAADWMGGQVTLELAVLPNFDGVTP